MKLYGLIGKKLSHSFSKNYFSEKFAKEQLDDYRYELFELKDITQIRHVLDQDNLQGFNITIPYKQEIIPYLDSMDSSAHDVGAVNVVKIADGKLTGYNSDYYGFKNSLENWVLNINNLQALVLGTGGASKAVTSALKALKVNFQLVSRNTGAENTITYDALVRELISENKLIINTTPLGMSPNIDSYPELAYDALTEDHYLYDLVYNPEVTQFLKKGIEKGSKIKNGLEMLHLQAEKSWEIWNS